MMPQRTVTHTSKLNHRSGGHSTFRLLLRTMGTLRRHLDPFFARSGISGAQWAILWNLYRAEEDGEPMFRVTDLGEKLLIRPPSVIGVIDRLARAGLIVRSSSKDDKRVKFIGLTPAGRELVETLHNEHDEKVTSLLAILSSTEQKQLNGLLERFVEHLDTIQVSNGRPTSLRRGSI